jgi:hypothetical protein
MGKPAPDAVQRLVDLSACNAQADLFDRERKVYQSPDYKEEQLRAEFLNPFFESLGWDVANKAVLTEVFKPVIHEESIRTAGATKASDHTFGASPAANVPSKGAPE